MWLSDLFSKTIEAATNVGKQAGEFIDSTTKGALEATHNQALLNALKQNIEQVDHKVDNLQDYPSYQNIAEQLKTLRNSGSYEDFLYEIVSNQSLFTTIMAIDVDNFSKNYTGKNDNTVIALAAIHYISDQIHRLIVNGDQDKIDGSVAIRNNGKNFQLVVKDSNGSWVPYQRGERKSEDQSLFTLPQIVWFHRFDQLGYNISDNQKKSNEWTTQPIDPQKEAEKLVNPANWESK